MATPQEFGKWVKDNIGLTIVSALAILVGGALLVCLPPWGRWLQGIRQQNSYSLAVWTWIGATMVAFAIVNAAFVIWSSQTTSTTDAATVFSSFWAIAIGLVLVLSVFFLYPEPTRQVHAFLALIGGGLGGWLVGMYISPQDSSERQEFAKIGTAIAGIASGYTLKTIETWFSKPDHAHYRIYFGLSMMSAALTTATIYNVRAYGLNGVNITFPVASADPRDKQKVAAKLNDTVQFVAAVSGPADTSVEWSIIPTTAGTMDPISGKFTASSAGSCKVYARSNGDPRLSDLVDVTVT